jgi:hypothetical protein
MKVSKAAVFMGCAEKMVMCRFHQKSWSSRGLGDFTIGINGRKR